MEMKKYKLRELLTIKNGKDHKQLKEGVYPVLGSGGVMRYVDTFLYDKPSVLLPRKGTLNNIQYSDKPFWTVDTLYYTEVNQDLTDTYYLFNYLKLLDLSNLDSGTGVPSMTFDSYYNLSVNLPSLKNQNKIATILAHIDKKIAINRQINRNLEELAKLIYDYWFVQFDFPNEEGKPYKSSGGKMVWNEILNRKIPDGWEVKLLKDIIEIKRGITITEKQTTSGTIKVVAAGLTYSYLHGESNRTPNCITVSGSGANAGFVNFWREPIFASDCSTIQFDNDIDTILCYHILKKQEKRFYQISHKSAQPHILPSDIGEIPMIIPSNSIKERISQFFIKTNKQIAENTKELEHLSSLRDNLLPLLMNGQVTLNSCLSLIIHLYNTIFARFNFTTRNSK